MGFTIQHRRANQGKFKPLYAVLFCLIAVAFGFYYLSKNGHSKQQPLYWVAPMDPNYRRDQPGKSPMGMDLVPVYEQDLTNSGSSEPGEVYLSAALQQKISVKTAQVKRGSLQQTVNAFGQVAYDSEKLQIMAAPAIAKVDYMVTSYLGEKVLKGLPLYALSSDQLVRAQEAYLDALKRDNRQALIASEQALQNLGFDRKLILELKRDGAAQESVVFRAPISGVVTQLNTAQGAYVSAGSVIMTIQPLDTVWVNLDVPVKYLNALSIGEAVTLTSNAAPDTTWQGKIDFIYPELNAKTQSLKVRCAIQNKAEQLKPNMFMSAKIDLAPQPDALLVPYQSVIRLGSHNRVVLALGEGYFKSIDVSLGSENSDWIEITSGLKEGDEIVVSAQFLIDSESSKTSDFKRFEQPQAEIRQANATATVEEVWLEQRKMRLTHSAIEQWQMPSMTMNFLVAPEVTLDKVKAGDQIEIKILDDPNQPLYIVEHLQPLSSKP